MSDTTTYPNRNPEATTYPEPSDGLASGGRARSSTHQADPDFKVEVPTEGQIIAVAKAMDVDASLDWESPDHDKVVACINAKEEARHFIIGVHAVRALMDGQLEVVEPVEPQPEPALAPLPDETQPVTGIGDEYVGGDGTAEYVAPPYVPPAPLPQEAATATS